MKDFYTLSDLQDRSVIDKGTDLPARLAVIGYPIAHSKSPAMQQAALDAAHKHMRYIRVQAAPDEFSATVEALKNLDFIGANVTVPHKSAAAALCEELDALAKATGAVNTLVFPTSSSGMMGFNTDGPGFAAAIRKTFDVDLRDLKIAILGANGGAGTALAHTCASNLCDKLVLVARSASKLSNLKTALSPYFIDERRLEGTSDRLRIFEFTDPGLVDAIDDADLIVNATSLGLKPIDPLPIPATMIQPHHLVYDLQTHLTRFQEAAVYQGARASDGRLMLLYQGALAFSCWFGIRPDTDAMRKGLERA